MVTTDTPAADTGPTDPARGLATRLRRVQRWTWSAALVWLLAAAGGGYWISQRVIDSYVHTTASSAAQDATTTVRTINRMFAEMANVSQMLSRQSAVQDFLSGHAARADGVRALALPQRRNMLKAAPGAQALGDYFATVGKDLGYSQVFLLDPTGIQVVASDWRTPGTRLGERQNEHDYYLYSALATGPGHMFSSATSAGSPGSFQRPGWTSTTSPQGWLSSSATAMCRPSCSPWNVSR